MEEILGDKGLSSSEIEVFRMALRRGDLEKIQELFTEDMSGWLSEVASIHGHLNIIKFIHEKELPLGEKFLYFASSNGNVNILDWAHKEGFDVLHTSIAETAAKYGSKEVIKFYLSHGGIWDKKICEAAASHDQKKIIKFILRRKLPMNLNNCALRCIEEGNYSLFRKVFLREGINLQYMYTKLSPEDHFIYWLFKEVLRPRVVNYTEG